MNFEQFRSPPSWLTSYSYPRNLLRAEARKGLVGLWLPGIDFGSATLRDVAGKRNLPFPNAPAKPTPTRTRYGSGLLFDNSDDYIVGDYGPWGIANQYSLVVLANVTATGEEHLFTADKASAGTQRVWQFRLESSGKVRFIRFNAAGNVVANFVTAGTYLNALHLFAATFSVSDGSNIYVDGTSYASDATTTANNDPGSEPYVIGAQAYTRPTGMLGFLGGTIYAVMFYQRRLPGAELQSLTANFWNTLFRPPAYFDLRVEAAGATTIRLTWTDNSEGEDGFSIERDTDGGGFVVIDTVMAGTESYLDTVDVGHTYTYRVRATSAALGDSEYSNEAEVIV